jgi:hypothetical protein
MLAQPLGCVVTLVVASVVASTAFSAPAPQPPQPTQPTASAAPDYGHGGVDAAVVHVFNGAMLGLWICESGPGCHSDEEMGATLGGASVGLLGGYLIGSQFPRAKVMMVNTGMIVGLLGGIVAADREVQERRSRDDWNFDRDAIELKNFLIGEAIGGALFGGLAALLEPTPARVTMANSVGWWSLYLGSLSEVTRDRPTTAAGAGATFGIGFATGWLLWDELHFARVSTWKVDLGGMLGAVGGVLWAQARNSKNMSGAVYPMMVGTVIGLGAGTWVALADDRVTGVPATFSMALQPTQNGPIVTLQGTF